MSHTFFATCPLHLEDLLAGELKSFHARDVYIHPSGVEWKGPLETAYRCCLWSRIASRVFLTLEKFNGTDKETLYERTKEYPWEEHIHPEGTFAVDATTRSADITHSGYTALLVKDAIADRFRGLYGKRPTVKPDYPDVQVSTRLYRNEVTLSLDISGESLHRRSYRTAPGPATLKENVAAGILYRAHWPKIAEQGGTLLDPMCGTGTLPIEAALIATDFAPGTLRSYFGFLGWLQHDEGIWESLIREAETRRKEGMNRKLKIYCSDHHSAAVAATWKNIEQLGLQKIIHCERKSLSEIRPPGSSDMGLLVVNPPYGERLGKEDHLETLYHTFGEVMRNHFRGWHVALFSGNDELAMTTGLAPDKVNTLYNGSIPCKIFHYSIFSKEEHKKHREKVKPLTPGAQMFANRLKKNLRITGKWAKKEGITSYRLYDADMPEYSAAIDYFEGKYLHIQEYAAPAEIPLEKARKHLKELLSAIPHVLDVEKQHIYLKQRSRQRGKKQYRKMGRMGKEQIIREGGFQFYVNFTDYLDTGIFLDHRLTRRIIQSESKERHFLNVFAYTGTATVYAAGGGASSTTTVDTSGTYLAWAERNMIVNGFKGNNHRYIREDAITYLSGEKRKYGLIFIDPPTFSNAKDRKEIFDIQRDHVRLITLAAGLLSGQGQIIFSTNYRKFRMDYDSLKNLRIEDITSKTIPGDYTRHKKIHYCWTIRS